MIKDKLNKKIGETLSRRDSIEMTFTKGSKTASRSKLSHLTHSQLKKEQSLRENKLI